MQTTFARNSSVGDAAAGFTVLEILVAVTIMGLAYVAILQNFSLSARNITNMAESRTALLSGAQVFERALLAMDQEDRKNDRGLDVVADGSSYELVEVVSDGSLFTTLKLKKK